MAEEGFGKDSVGSEADVFCAEVGVARGGVAERVEEEKEGVEPEEGFCGDEGDAEVTGVRVEDGGRVGHGQIVEEVGMT